MSRIALLLYVLTTSAALVVLKFGTKSGLPIGYAGNKLQFNLNFYSIAGVLLYGISFALYVYLIAKNDLGHIIPITTALVYILVFAASYFIFKEAFTAFKITGILLILSGLIFLNLKK